MYARETKHLPRAKSPFAWTVREYDLLYRRETKELPRPKSPFAWTAREYHLLYCRFVRLDRRKFHRASEEFEVDPKREPLAWFRKPELHRMCKEAGIPVTVGGKLKVKAQMVRELDDHFRAAFLAIMRA